MATWGSSGDISCGQAEGTPVAAGRRGWRPLFTRLQPEMCIQRAMITCNEYCQVQKEAASDWTEAALTL